MYPMPGLNTLLSTCVGRVGRSPNGSESAKRPVYTPHIVEWFLGSSLEKGGFNPRLIFLSYRFGHAKPSMFMFKRAADELSRINIPVAAALYVGNDMLNDIRQRHHQEFETALFAGDGRSLRPRESDDRCSDLHRFNRYQPSASDAPDLTLNREKQPWTSRPAHIRR